MINKIITILLLFIFAFINLFFITLKSNNYPENNITLELYNFLQIITIDLLILYALKKIKILAILFVALINNLYIVFDIYFVTTANKLDFFYFKKNIGQISYITEHFQYILITLIFISLINTWVVYKIRPKFKFKFYYLIIFFIIITTLVVQPKKYDNGLLYFIKTSRHNDSVISYYENTYDKIIKKSIINNNLSPKINTTTPEYLENIIIIHLESLNGFLVNEKHTPTLLEIASNGVLFKNYYSNSVQTKSAYENILCSLPNSFENNLVDTGLDKNILCLPRLLSKLDYSTYWFKGGSRLEITKANDFSSNIGFQELHNDDIMDPDEPKYSWGYREDVFFEKAFNYIAKEKQAKNFFYIDVGTTNHYPFITPEELKNTVPYQAPENNKEIMSNTIFLQDMYLKIAWDKINELFPEKNYTLFVLSDNSWPVGIQSDNSFVQKNAFEENFRTPLAVVFGGQEEYKGKLIENRYSHMDIMPTILDLLDIDAQNKFATSFLPELEYGKIPNRRIIMTQPYSKKYINVIDGNMKYQYNSTDKNIISYNLENDDMEINPSMSSTGEKESLEFLYKFLD